MYVVEECTMVEVSVGHIWSLYGKDANKGRRRGWDPTTTFKSISPMNRTPPNRFHHFPVAASGN